MFLTKATVLRFLQRQKAKNKSRRQQTVDEDLTIPEESARLLSKEFYEEGYTFGRDALWHHMKSKYGVDRAPSRRDTMKWLKKQKLAQEFQQQKKGGTTNYFVPTAPFRSLSLDLIDFNFRGVNKNRYILVVIDNFSRFMFTKPLKSKETSATKKALTEVFEDMNRAYPDSVKKVKYLNTDDGPEWKGEFTQYLRNQNITRRRTLGGHPQQNGLVERSNGKLKMILAKLIKINGKNWLHFLPKATKIYNDQIVRTTKYTPKEALELSEDDRQKLIDNVKANQDFDQVVKKDILKVGDRVRVKIAKGVLGKASTPNWSSDIFVIGRVIQSANPQIADKYKLRGKAQDQLYSKNDLQKVIESEEYRPRNPPTQEDRDEGNDQLRLNELATVEGAFNQDALEQDREDMDRRFPRDFDRGAERTENQNRRLRKKVDRLSQNKSDKEIRRETGARPAQKKQRQVTAEEEAAQEILATDKILKVETHRPKKYKKNVVTEYRLKWNRPFTEGGSDTTFETLERAEEYDEVVKQLGGKLDAVKKIKAYQKKYIKDKGGGRDIYFNPSLQ